MIRDILKRRMIFDTRLIFNTWQSRVWHEGCCFCRGSILLRKSREQHGQAVSAMATFYRTVRYFPFYLRNTVFPRTDRTGKRNRLESKTDIINVVLLHFLFGQITCRSQSDKIKHFGSFLKRVNVVNLHLLSLSHNLLQDF